MRHLGLALSRAGIEAALLEEDRPVRPFSFPARFAISPEAGLDFRWDDDPDSVSLEDVERHVRDPRNQAAFLEQLLVRVLLEVAAAGTTFAPSGAALGIGLDHRAPAAFAAAAIGAGRRLGFPRVRVLYLHEAAAASMLIADAAPEAHAAVEVGPRGTVVRLEKRTASGRVALRARPDDLEPTEGLESFRLAAAQATSGAAAGLARLSAAGDPPLARDWHYALSFGGRELHSPELVPLEGGPRRVAYLAARADRPKWDPEIVLLAGLGRDLPVAERGPCGFQIVNKWVLEDNAGRFVAFLEIDDDRTIRWGHLFPRTGERVVATVPPEALAS